MSSGPLISIITIVRNDLRGLQQTFESVRAQSFKDFEYIVIDGASTDGTKEYNEQHLDQVDVFVSEPDKGLYDAMNKGTERANGQWALYLNAGDSFYAPDVLELAAAEFTQAERVYFGRGRIQFETGEGWLSPPSCISNRNCKFWLGASFPAHQAIFFPKSFYQNSRYRLDMKISADSDFKSRAFAAHEYTFFQTVIARFELGGVSTERTIKSQLRQSRDRLKRLGAPQKYIDFPISLLKGAVRYLSYHILGNRSYFLLNWAKNRSDCLRVGLKSLMHAEKLDVQ
jgi:putative colanic acid biosynthesis glycosyltransferase